MVCVLGIILHTIHLGMYILLAMTTNSKNYDSFVVIKQPANGNDIIIFASRVVSAPEHNIINPAAAGGYLNNNNSNNNICLIPKNNIVYHTEFECKLKATQYRNLFEILFFTLMQFCI